MTEPSRVWASMSQPRPELQLAHLVVVSEVTPPFDYTLTFLPLRSERRRLSSVKTFLRIRILDGVTSTNSSSSIYSRASSSVSSRGAFRRIFLSEPEARILVNFFSLQGLTVM